MRQGLVQVYTGDGKGKSTAATGLIVRALGQGLRVLLVRFLKPLTPPSGEIALLEGTAGLEILTSGIGVIGAAPPRQDVERSVAETFAEARRRLLAGEFDLVVMDELNNTLDKGYLPLDRILELLEEKPEGVELVLTGRRAHPEVLARADLVTRMENVRHPMERGIGARKGIEY